MTKKICCIILVMTLIINIITGVNADYKTVIMEVVDTPVNKIDFSQNAGFTKQLVDKDLNNKEVTIELKVKNEEKESIPEGELVLVMDNSLSMNELADGESKRIELINAATKKLINSLLTGNDNLKISIVSFSTTEENEGTINDASVLQTLTKNKELLNTALDNMTADGFRTDLQAGIELGKTQFTTEANDKYMIILTDGLPNVCIYENLSTEDANEAKRLMYCDVVINATKTSLTNVSTSNISLISMLTGIDDPDAYPVLTCPYTYSEYAQKVFGTQASPVAGQFFYTEDKDIDHVISEEILDALKPKSKTYKNIVIDDEFPAYIVDNFDFSYVQKPEIGTISPSIENKKITWTIPELKPGEVAICKYKLKLKQNFSQSIVDTLLKTNSNVEITYKDLDDQKQEKENPVSPTLKLKEPPAQLPYAGNIAYTSSIVCVVIVTLYFYIRFKNIR